ncbi:MAG: hypothetical protein ACHQF3_10885 [Alphaproteobacteria bacterium]
MASPVPARREATILVTGVGPVGLALAVAPAAPHPLAKALSVIRPDGYFGLLAVAEDWGSVESYLESFLMPG